MNSQLNWGMVGHGGNAKKFVNDLAVAECGKISVVCGRDEHRAAAFASEHSIAHSTVSLEALAADNSIEVVFITPPHSAHYEAAKMMLEAGKAVLCEKPLTVSAAQARELVALARKKKVFLMEALWTRFLPAVQMARRWIGEGRIGRPRVAASTFCYHLNKDPKSRNYNPDLAGGALLDMGVYNISISNFLLGNDVVDTAATAHFADTGVDETTSVSLLYASGAISQFICSMDCEMPNDFLVAGEEGTIRLPGLFIMPQSVEIIGKEVVQAPYTGGGFNLEIQEVARCLSEGRTESSIHSLEDTLVSMEILDVLRKKIGLEYPNL